MANKFYTNKNWFWGLLLFTCVFMVVWIGLIISESFFEQSNVSDSDSINSSQYISGPEEPKGTTFGNNIKHPGVVFTNQPFLLELRTKAFSSNSEIIFYVDGVEICKGFSKEKCYATIKRVGKSNLKICNLNLNRCDTLWISVISKEVPESEGYDGSKSPVAPASSTASALTTTSEPTTSGPVTNGTTTSGPASNSIDKEFTSNGKAGYRSSDRCDDNKKVVTTPCTLKLTPKKDFELKYVKVLSRKSARVDVTLSSNGGDKTEFLKNRQILAGQPSELNFQSLDYVFRKGVSYTITVAPVPGNSFELEDFSACNTADGGNSEVTISQAGGQVFFEVTYKY
jgi:hypothetical protein